MESFWIMIILMVIFSYLVMENVMLTFRNGIYNHLNKVYMSFLMGTLMANISFIIMLGYDIKNKFLWLGLIISLILSFTFIVLIRKQIFIGDRQFLKGMTEHHSQALLMSERLLEKTKDMRLIILAKNIINSQQYEIDLMKNYLKN